MCQGSYATTLLECCVATVRNHAATSMIPVQDFITVAVPLLCLDNCVVTLRNHAVTSIMVPMKW